MAFEKVWLAVPAKSFTSNGTAQGVVTVASTKGLYAKQKVFLRGTAQTTTQLEIKRVVSKTQLWVGPIKTDIKAYSDISNFTTAAASTIEAPEQPRPAIPQVEMDRATFEEEPVVARRVVLVDELGNKYSTDNPLPTQLSDGSINIGTVNAEIEVQLSHVDNDPNFGDVHDSVRVGDGINVLAVNNDGSIKTVKMFTKPYDTVTATYPSATQEVYKSRVGGVGGVVQETITVDYTDFTKNLILNAVRT